MADIAKGAARTGRARSFVRLHPLAPTTFLFRNLGKTIPLTLVIMLSVVLVAGVIALIDSIPYSIRTIYGYTSESFGVSPRGDVAAMPGVLKQIKTGAPFPIERIVLCRISTSQVDSIVGKWPFIVFGLSQPDMKFFLDRQGMRGLEGRMPIPGKPEAIVSDPVAKNLGLHLGSVIQAPDKTDSYSPLEVKVVGIAHTSRWLMVNTIEYQRLHHFPPIDLAMVFAKDHSQQPALDKWAEKHFKGQRTEVFTFRKIDDETRKMFKTLFQIVNIVIAMLVLVITLMMAMLINIYQTQRLVEFGLLQAIGFTRRRLVRRALVENVIVVILGWLMGLCGAFLLLLSIRATLMAPKAFAMEVLDRGPYAYTIPIPLTIIVVASLTVALRFRRFDPVAIVERRLV